MQILSSNVLRVILTVGQRVRWHILDLRIQLVGAGSGHVQLSATDYGALAGSETERGGLRLQFFTGVHVLTRARHDGSCVLKSHEAGAHRVDRRTLFDSLGSGLMSTRSGKGMNIFLGVVKVNLGSHVELGLLGVESGGFNLISTCTRDQLGFATIVRSLPLSGADFEFGRLHLGEGGVGVINIGGRRYNTLLNERGAELTTH